MSTPGHKSARNRFAKLPPLSSSSYSFRDYKQIAEEVENEELEWSYEEDLYSEEDDSEFEAYSEEDYDDIDDDEYDSDFDEDDDHEYIESDRYRNDSSAGPGYFYPEQPYVPLIAKPASENPSSKLNYYILSPLCDIATIYIKFAILAILIYACALWYTVYYGDLSSLDDMDGSDDADADTCPANLST